MTLKELFFSMVKGGSGVSHKRVLATACILFTMLLILVCLVFDIDIPIHVVDSFLLFSAAGMGISQFDRANLPFGNKETCKETTQTIETTNSVDKDKTNNEPII